MATPKNRQVESLTNDFRTALTLQVPTAGSTGRLTDSDNEASDASMSSRGGSERGFPMPKIMVMSLNGEIE